MWQWLHTVGTKEKDEEKEILYLLPLILAISLYMPKLFGFKVAKNQRKNATIRSYKLQELRERVDIDMNGTEEAAAAAIASIVAVQDHILLSDERLSISTRSAVVHNELFIDEHEGISTCPGRLIPTDHAFYFEILHDFKRTVKPELIGPRGTRFSFDKTVSYSSVSLSKPVVLEFPKPRGHAHHDYWLAIIHEILRDAQGQRKFVEVEVVCSCMRNQLLYDKRLKTQHPISFPKLLGCKRLIVVTYDNAHVQEEIIFDSGPLFSGLHLMNSGYLLHSDSGAISPMSHPLGTQSDETLSGLVKSNPRLEEKDD
ncbi:hypothetical protein VNO77_20243 [Canavalia gladiata]|uniref:Uncharacterized protein n=1 Tax=Canavalia gladiata TaxID=3824 RepID=A0AAN9LP34_CANGL